MSKSTSATKSLLSQLQKSKLIFHQFPIIIHPHHEISIPINPTIKNQLVKKIPQYCSANKLHPTPLTSIKYLNIVFTSPAPNPPINCQLRLYQKSNHIYSTRLIYKNNLPTNWPNLPPKLKDNLTNNNMIINRTDNHQIKLINQLSNTLKTSHNQLFTKAISLTNCQSFSFNNHSSWQHSPAKTAKSSLKNNYLSTKPFFYIYFKTKIFYYPPSPKPILPIIKKIASNFNQQKLDTLLTKIFPYPQTPMSVILEIETNTKEYQQQANKLVKQLFKYAC